MSSKRWQPTVFMAFVRKEFKHVLRDRRSLVILLGLPVVMMILYGFALSNEVKNSNFVVLDRARDAGSRQLIERLDGSKYFSFVRTLADEAEVRDVFRKGEARLAVLIPANFNHDLHHGNQTQLRFVADASDPNTASIAIGYASAIVGQWQGELMAGTPPLDIRVESRMLYNPQLKSSYGFVPGVMTLILMLLGAMMTSVSIVREKERGTVEVLLVSPMNPLVVLISKAVPYMLLCFIDVIIILLLAYNVLDMPVRGSLPLLLAASLLFILTTLSLGLVISNLVDTQQTAIFISLVGLLMPCLVFSGFMFPIENMPAPLQLFSNLVPTKWFYMIVRGIMVKGGGLATIAQPVLVLALMTLAFTGLALRFFKERLEP